MDASAYAAASPAPDARQPRAQPGEREGDEEPDQAQDERLLAAEDDLVAIAGNESDASTTVGYAAARSTACPNGALKARQ